MGHSRLTIHSFRHESSGFLITFKSIGSRALTKYWVQTIAFLFGRLVSWPVDHRGIVCDGLFILTFLTLKKLTASLLHTNCYSRGLKHRHANCYFVIVFYNEIFGYRQPPLVNLWPIFVRSMKNLSDSCKKYSHIGLISAQNWLLSRMPNLLPNVTRALVNILWQRRIIERTWMHLVLQ